MVFPKSASSTVTGLCAVGASLDPMNQTPAAIVATITATAVLIMITDRLLTPPGKGFAKTDDGRFPCSSSIAASSSLML